MYKTYTFEQNFQKAFDAMYGQEVRQAEQKLKKFSRQVEQNNCDQEISRAMETHGLSRNEAIMLLYPNG